MDRVLVSHLSVWFALFAFCAQNEIDSRKLVSLLNESFSGDEWKCKSSKDVILP